MRITRLVSLVSCSLATILNSLLIILILTRSSSRIGKYKYFLLAYTLNACYFTVAQICILPTWYVPYNGCLLLSTTTVLPVWIQQIQVTCFVSSYNFNAIILAWCFLYRLAIIQNNQPWIVTHFRYSLTFSVLLGLYMVTVCSFINPTERSEHMFREEIFNATGVELAEVGYIGAEITIDGHLNIGPCITFVSYLVFLFIACSIFVVCWFKIGSQLQELRNSSSGNYRLQKKLFILLTIQTCLPIVFNNIPAIMVIVLGLTKVECGDVILICGMVLSFAQLCDPIFTVILVSDYKEVIVRLHKKTWGAVSLPTTSS